MPDPLNCNRKIASVDAPSAQPLTPRGMHITGGVVHVVSKVVMPPDTYPTLAAAMKATKGLVKTVGGWIWLGKGLMRPTMSLDDLEISPNRGKP